MKNPLIVIKGIGTFLGGNNLSITKIVKENYILAIDCFYSKLKYDVVYEIEDSKTGETETKLLKQDSDDDYKNYKKDNFRMQWQVQGFFGSDEFVQDIMHIIEHEVVYDSIVFILFGRGACSTTQIVNDSKVYDTNCDDEDLNRICDTIGTFTGPKLFFIDLLWQKLEKVELEEDEAYIEESKHKAIVFDDDEKNNYKHPLLEQTKTLYFNTLKMVSNIEPEHWKDTGGNGSFFVKSITDFFQSQIGEETVRLEWFQNIILDYVLDAFYTAHPKFNSNVDIIACEEALTETEWVFDI